VVRAACEHARMQQLLEFLRRATNVLRGIAKVTATLAALLEAVVALVGGRRNLGDTEMLILTVYDPPRLRA
jgi:hypothetical protein